MLEKQSKKIIIKDYSLPTVVERNCLVCNNIFTIKRKDIWNGGGKYCSKECSHIGRGILKSLNYRKNRIEKQQEIQAEREQIKADAVANGTWMKAPNGNPTNLNEQQWVDVRTKRFADFSV